MPLLELNVLKLQKAGCKLADPPHVFVALLHATKNDPCKGCVFFNDEKCRAYQQYHSVPREQARKRQEEAERNSSDQSGLIGGKWKGMNSKQIQEKEGISRAEFQRRKQAGHYKE